MREVQVIGDSRVLIAPGLLDEVPGYFASAGIHSSAYVVVSDETVFGLYGNRIIEAFARYGVSTEGGCNPRLLTYTITPGEASKSRETKAAVEDFMIANKCSRDTVVVALGGGVVGDLAGFVAATYMRGVTVVQIPTSTMAMLDSSVGGKTAINVPAGKNLIGAFHQPRLIIADPHVLHSLSHREIVEGLAEAIKMGIIRDAGLFQFMSTESQRIMGLEPLVLQEVLYSAIGHKAHVVALDEKETGLRATLNFGHTIGHAIEAVVSPALLHGECVSIGCVAEATLAYRMGHLPHDAIGTIRACFEAYGLPVHFPPGLTVAKLMAKMAVDKKTQAHSIHCAIITGIGQSIEYAVPVAKEMMEAVLHEMLPAPMPVAAA